jgi:hypothetical protein
MNSNPSRPTPYCSATWLLGSVSSMKTRMMLASLSVLCSLVGFGAEAQSQFQFTFHGTCWTTNAAGQFISRKINNKTLLQDFAPANILTNSRSLALVYHVNADERGDTIEVVNTADGTIVFPLLSLFFGTAFERVALDTGNGLQEKRIDYVYSHQIDHSIGSTLSDVHFSRDRNGKTNRSLISGQMDYILLPDAQHPTLQICNGNFTTGRAVTFTNAP